MKTKTLIIVSLIFSSSLAFAEMPDAGIAGDMAKDAATDALKEKVTDTAKDMVQGTVSPEASSESTDKDEKATGTGTPKSSTEGEPSTTDKPVEFPK